MISKKKKKSFFLQHNDDHANGNEDNIVRGSRWHGRFARIYAEDHGHIYDGGKEGPLEVTHLPFELMTKTRKFIVEEFRRRFSCDWFYEALWLSIRRVLGRWITSSRLYWARLARWGHVHRALLRDAPLWSHAIACTMIYYHAHGLCFGFACLSVPLGCLTSLRSESRDDEETCLCMSLLVRLADPR